MICPACGAKNREGARFCHTCGRPIDELEHQDAGPQEQAEGAQEVEEPPEAALAEEPGPEPGAGGAPTEGHLSDLEPEPLPGEERGDQDAAPDEGASLPPVAESPAKTEPLDGGDVMPESEPPLDVEPPPGEAVAARLATEEGEGEAPSEPAFEPISEPEVDLDLDEEYAPSAFWREEAEPLDPASPGTLIASRYLVLEVLDAGENEVLYLARDLARCWQCGAELDAGEVFCPQCGAAQAQPSVSASGIRLLEVRPPGDDAHPEMGVLSRLTHEGRPFLVLAPPKTAPEPEPLAAASAPEGIRLIVGQQSDPGQVRELNEDSVLTIQVAPTYQSVTSPVLGLFAVADGMGGHDGGEIASKLALQVLGDHTLRTILLPELAGELRLDQDVLAHLRQALLAANDAVFLARQKRGNDMGTTLTAILVRDRRLLIAHVGDCRAYRWSEAGLEQLTTDHSVVASMIAHGQVSPDEIYTHPHRSVVYRCIGDQPMVEVDGDLLPLEPGNRLVVCSDGLWEMVRSEGIADVMMQEANPQVACDLLVRLANAAGGEDNISVVIVQIEAA